MVTEGNVLSLFKGVTPSCCGTWSPQGQPMTPAPQGQQMNPTSQQSHSEMEETC